MFVFAPDYIELLENFSMKILRNISFIEHKDSRHKEELISLGIYESDYPIGVLEDKYELHFLHYSTQEDAREKWLKRINRINTKKLIFKFSADYKYEDSMAQRFEKLKFKNKVCFSAKEHPELQSIVSLKKFKNHARVRDEWKYSSKEFNVTQFINEMQIGQEI